MIKKILISCLFLTLGACNKLGSKKTYDIVDLTPRVQAEAHSQIVSIPTSQELSSWGENSSFPNPNIFNIKSGSDFSVGKFTKLYSEAIIADPVIVENKIFILNNKANISSFDSKNLNKIWSYDLDVKSKNHSTGGVVYHQGNLYITYGARELVILNAESGKEILRKSLPDISKTKPLIINDNIIVKLIDHTLIAFNHKGETTWSPLTFPSEMLVFSQQFSPIHTKNLIILNNPNGDLIALNNKGEVRWSLSISDDSKYDFNLDSSDISSKIVFDQSNIYVSGGLNHFAAINLESGKIVWDKKLYDIKNIWRAGNYLFAVNNASQALCFDKNNGKVLWATDLEVKLGKKETSEFVSTLIINDKLYIATIKGVIYELNPISGEVINIYNVKKDIHSMVALNNKIYVFATKNSVMLVK